MVRSLTLGPASEARKRRPDLCGKVRMSKAKVSNDSQVPVMKARVKYPERNRHT